MYYLLSFMRTYPPTVVTTSFMRTYPPTVVAASFAKGHKIFYSGIARLADVADAVVGGIDQGIDHILAGGWDCGDIHTKNLLMCVEALDKWRVRA